MRSNSWPALPQRNAAASLPAFPPSNFWASDDTGMSQVGCGYTAHATAGETTF